MDEKATSTDSRTASSNEDAPMKALRDARWCGEKPVVLLTFDDDGDFIARDLTRDGCICHASTEVGAIALLLDYRKAYDRHRRSRS